MWPVMKCKKALALFSVVIAISACGNKPTVATNVTKTEKPNIIYILVDDAGVGDVGVYNPNSKIPTPNLDQMAREGMRFTDAHSPSSVCTPTRYSVLTGRYAWRSRLKKGVLFGYSPALIEEDRETVASMLQKQGYQTAAIGKWHLGLGKAKKTNFDEALTPGPVDHGFDYFYGISASLDMPPYAYIENDRLVKPATGFIRSNGSSRGKLGGESYWRKGKISDDFKHIEALPKIVNRAEKYIRDVASSDKPFFMYLPLPAPHQPWIPAPEYQNKSKAGAYGDFMFQIDAIVGQITKALKDTGIEENTMIVFTSDNGSHWYDADSERWGHKANLDWRGRKADIYEGGHRVPLIVKWPNKVPSNTVSNELVSLTDFMATAAAMTGAEISKGMAEDSKNMLPGLLNNDQYLTDDDTTVMHSINGTFAIRKGYWKLIDAPHSGGFKLGNMKQYESMPQVQLYNLETDPSETTNLFAVHPEKVKELLSMLEQVKQPK